MENRTQGNMIIFSYQEYQPVPVNPAYRWRKSESESDHSIRLNASASCGRSSASIRPANQTSPIFDLASKSMEPGKLMWSPAN